MSQEPGQKPATTTDVDRVLASALRCRWLALPVGPGAEFAGVAPIYWVSDHGTVLWCAPRAPCGRKIGIKSKRLDVKKPGKGRRKWSYHEKINLKIPGERGIRTARVHRVVLAAFAPNGTGLGRHDNDDGLDNRLGNLLYGSHSDNLRDAYRNGRTPANQWTAGADDEYAALDDGLMVYQPDAELGF